MLIQKVYSSFKDAKRAKELSGTSSPINFEPNEKSLRRIVVTMTPLQERRLWEKGGF